MQFLKRFCEPLVGVELCVDDCGKQRNMGGKKECVVLGVGVETERGERAIGP